MCIGLPSGARVGKTNTVQVCAFGLSSGAIVGKVNTVQALHWLVEPRKSGKDKHSASLCISLSSGARMGKTNKVQVSAALDCRATQEWEIQIQCKSVQHWLVERRKMGKTNTVQVSELACRLAQ